jgi:hypothetical protein
MRVGIIDKRKRFSRFMTGAIGVALLAGSAQAGAQSGPPANAPAPAVDAFREQAGRLGVQRCADLFAGMGRGVALGSTYTVQVQADPSAPDAHAVQGVVGMAYNRPDYRGQAAGIVLAAPVGQACEGQLVRVAPFQRSCQQVVGLLPAGSTAAGNLSGVPLYDLGDDQGQALLVPSGATCVVVTVARTAAVP